MPAGSRVVSAIARRETSCSRSRGRSPRVAASVAAAAGGRCLESVLSVIDNRIACAWRNSRRLLCWPRSAATSAWPGQAAASADNHAATRAPRARVRSQAPLGSPAPGVHQARPTNQVAAAVNVTNIEVPPPSRALLPWPCPAGCRPFPLSCPSLDEPRFLPDRRAREEGGSTGRARIKERKEGRPSKKARSGQGGGGCRPLAC